MLIEFFVVSKLITFHTWRESRNHISVNFSWKNGYICKFHTLKHFFIRTRVHHFSVFIILKLSLKTILSKTEKFQKIKNSNNFASKTMKNVLEKYVIKICKNCNYSFFLNNPSSLSGFRVYTSVTLNFSRFFHRIWLGE